MNIYITTLLVSLVICFASIFNNNGSANPAEKNVEESSPDFKNVDVVIIYEHNGEEYLENVDTISPSR